MSISLNTINDLWHSYPAIFTVPFKGIILKSGEELDADIIVTATGLNLEFFGGIEIIVDGQPLDTTDKMYYKGVMFEDLPNLGMTLKVI